jgi:lysyl-tRNA synthetase class 2
MDHGEQALASVRVLASLLELGTLCPGERALLRGRVTAADRSTIRLEDHQVGVTLALDGLARPPLGAWVEGEVRAPTDGSPRLQALHVRGLPRASFPRAGGDWLALHRDGKRAIRRLEARAAACRAIRAHFDAAGFLEVETPLAVPSPGLDVHLAAFEVKGMRGPTVPAERWLLTSPEYQMKRLLAGGLPRIYQLARCFRRDEQGARHEPEFTMVEWYRTFADVDAVIADTEALVAATARALTGGTSLHLDALGVGPRHVDLTPPWPRIGVDEALRLHAGTSLAALLPDEERFFLVWSAEVEPRLGHDRPVVVVDWPACMASLARLQPDRPHLADRFEAYVAGVELCNGFGELVDPVEQRARLEADRARRARAGLDVYPIDERFLGALEEGLPPSAGNALGLDRLVALLTGAASIEDVMAFGARRL